MRTVTVTMVNASDGTKSYTGVDARWSTIDGYLKVWLDNDVVAEFYPGTWKYIISQDES